MTIRRGTNADLARINDLVDSATRAWGLKERVERLALPSLRYRAGDFCFMRFVVACDTGGSPCAVAALEEATDGVEKRPHSILLHGLYVSLAAQRGGLGTALVSHVVADATARGFSIIQLHAWRDSESFFSRLGFQPTHTGSCNYSLELNRCPAR
jgi:N-acetylglutamate synthase-like GNAT family acetyltransferase